MSQGKTELRNKWVSDTVNPLFTYTVETDHDATRESLHFASNLLASLPNWCPKPPFFFLKFIYLRERARMRARAGGGAEKEGDRESHSGWVQSLMSGSTSRIVRSWPELNSRAGRFDRLSPPGGPSKPPSKKKVSCPCPNHVGLQTGTLHAGVSQDNHFQNMALRWAASGTLRNLSETQSLKRHPRQAESWWEKSSDWCFNESSQVFRSTMRCDSHRYICQLHGMERAAYHVREQMLHDCLQGPEERLRALPDFTHHLTSALAHEPDVLTGFQLHYFPRSSLVRCPKSLILSFLESLLFWEKQFVTCCESCLLANS